MGSPIACALVIVKLLFSDGHVASDRLLPQRLSTGTVSYKTKIVSLSLNLVQAAEANGFVLTFSLRSLDQSVRGMTHNVARGQTQGRSSHVN